MENRTETFLVCPDRVGVGVSVKATGPRAAVLLVDFLIGPDCPKIVHRDFRLWQRREKLSL